MPKGIGPVPDCLIGLGSNLGNRAELLAAAACRIASLPQVKRLGQSTWHETRPIGGPAGQGAFLNGALRIETSLSPQALWARLKAIEAELGRGRTQRWGPRRIDLDLLLFGRRQIETAELVVPHAGMAWRRFVLAPAVEVAAEMVHPAIGWSVARLLEHLDTAKPYVALAAAPGRGKTRLAQQLSRRLGGRMIATPAVASSPGGAPSGRAWSGELEWLKRRAEVLAAGGPCWGEPARLWVSDFWFDQSLAYAQANLPKPRYDAFRRQWERERVGVVAPKLIVLVEPLGERPGEKVGLQGQGGDAPRRALGEAIAALARRPGQGPLLEARGLPAQRLLDNVAAAMEAMEPY